MLFIKYFDTLMKIKIPTEMMNLQESLRRSLLPSDYMLLQKVKLPVPKNYFQLII